MRIGTSSPATGIWWPIRSWGTGACIRRGLIPALLMASLLFSVVDAVAAGLSERVIVPKRAPEHLRAAQLEAIDAALARRLVDDAPLERADLAAWLRHRGHSLSRLLQATGMDPARLVLSAIEREDAVGGPFVAFSGDTGLDDQPEIDPAFVLARVLETVPLQSPVRDPHRVTSGFGKRSDPFRGRAAFHRGIDLAAPRGTPIYAPAGGTVVRAGRLGGFGNIVEVDHGNGVVTRYAHLYAYHVRTGDVVGPGARVGLMGRTGRATGVHLHYEVLVDGRHVDPARFLDVGRRLAADLP